MAAPAAVYRPRNPQYSDFQDAPVPHPVSRGAGSVMTAGSGGAFSDKPDGPAVLGIFDVAVGRFKGGDGIVAGCVFMACVSATVICFISLEGVLIGGSAG